MPNQEKVKNHTQKKTTTDQYATLYRSKNPQQNTDKLSPCKKDYTPSTSRVCSRNAKLD